MSIDTHFLYFYFILSIVDLSNISPPRCYRLQNQRHLLGISFSNIHPRLHNRISLHILFSYFDIIFVISSSISVNHIPKVGLEGKEEGKGCKLIKRRMLRFHVYHKRVGKEFKGIRGGGVGFMNS